jgi:uncharacterized membrane protein YgcG
MAMGARVVAILLACGCLAAGELTASAAERITAIAAEITVTADGSLSVAETITVVAEGVKIRHGIYRDIPVRYSGGPFGMPVFVDFDLGAATCDGQAVPVRRDHRGEFVRVFVGDPARELAPGEHTYVIRYTTPQLRFLADHDEVYWNATGHAWEFPIDVATATVILPATTAAEQIRAEAYAGPLGSKRQDGVRVEIDRDRRRVAYAASRPLVPGEGLTIVAGFPKGSVPERSAAGLMWSDPFLRFGLGGLAVTAGFCFIAWWLAGRGGMPGEPVPLRGPPEAACPAACRFIRRMGYDNDCFSATLLSLASQGALAIHSEAGEYTLEKTGEPAATAWNGERRVFKTLLADCDRLAVGPRQQRRFSRAIDGLRSDLVEQFQGTMFRPNRGWLSASLVVAGLALLGSAGFAGGLPAVFIVGFLAMWLSFWTAVVCILAYVTIACWRAAGSNQALAGRLGGLVKASVVTVATAVFAAGEVFGLWMLGSSTSPWMIPIVAALGAVLVLFIRRIKAPTAAGWEVMREIEGFRLTLLSPQAALAGPPAPRLLEQWLPYAVALDLADEWLGRFRQAVGAAAAEESTAGHRPVPLWYHAEGLASGRGLSAMAGLGASLTSAVTAAASSPSSGSGSGGGGSAGGGGGGGGGGGW